MSLIIENLMNWLLFNSSKDKEVNISNNNINNVNSIGTISNTNNIDNIIKKYNDRIIRNDGLNSFNVACFQSLSYSCLTYIANYLNTGEFIQFLKLFRSKDVRSIMLLCRTTLILPTVTTFDNNFFDMASISRY
jgi:hypothetical protein